MKFMLFDKENVHAEPVEAGTACLTSFDRLRVNGGGCLNLDSESLFPAPLLGPVAREGEPAGIHPKVHHELG